MGAGYSDIYPARWPTRSLSRSRRGTNENCWGGFRTLAVGVFGALGMEFFGGRFCRLYCRVVGSGLAMFGLFAAYGCSVCTCQCLVKIMTRSTQSSSEYSFSRFTFVNRTVAGWKHLQFFQLMSVTKAVSISLYDKHRFSALVLISPTKGQKTQIIYGGLFPSTVQSEFSPFSVSFTPNSQLLLLCFLIGTAPKIW